LKRIATASTDPSKYIHILTALCLLSPVLFLFVFANGNPPKMKHEIIRRAGSQPYKCISRAPAV